MNKIVGQLKFLKHKYTPWYKRDYKEFVKLSSDNKDFIIYDNYPCVKDKFLTSGISSGHYFHQDLYVAREIFHAHPIKHVDIGSRIDGFIAHVAVFREIEVFDIRPLVSKINNVLFRQSDFMKELTVFENYCDSISCLHTIEHFGLGRYGDKIDPDGHLRGFENISKMLQEKGKFYFSVPMGPNRVEFNAHRIFGLKYLLDWVIQQYNILKFAYIDDKGDIFENVLLTSEMINTNCNCNHGCAIFVLEKK